METAPGQIGCQPRKKHRLPTGKKHRLPTGKNASVANRGKSIGSQPEKKHRLPTEEKALCEYCLLAFPVRHPFTILNALDRMGKYVTYRF